MSDQRQKLKQPNTLAGNERSQTEGSSRSKAPDTVAQNTNLSASVPQGRQTLDTAALKIVSEHETEGASSQFASTNADVSIAAGEKMWQLGVEVQPAKDTELEGGSQSSEEKCRNS